MSNKGQIMIQWIANLTTEVSILSNVEFLVGEVLGGGGFEQNVLSTPDLIGIRVKINKLW